jgi:hypothetical protein
VFSQLLSLISRPGFSSAVKEFKTEKGAKGFSSWDHLVSMLYCQLAQAKSLREINYGLESCLGRLNHLGMREAPRRSTLSYANGHRDWRVFQSAFFDLLGVCQSIAPAQAKFKFKNKLLSMDATVIDLCAEVFDWAQYRTTKGAVKLHLLLDHDGYLPVFAHIAEGKRHEINVAREIAFPAGSVIAFDRGYNDYGFFESLNAGGVFFVTRLKSNAAHETVETLPLPRNRPNIRSVELIRLKGTAMTLKKVEVWNEENQTLLTLISNKIAWGATTIAAIYKERWQIEIFFKQLKQNLKVKTFVGTSANAVHIQIWTALIAMLIIKCLKFKSKYDWSLSNLVALLRLNLFTYRNLWAWLDSPLNTPPLEAEMFQPLLGRL